MKAILRARSGGGRFLTAALALWIAFFSVIQLTATTPTGTHCPTAPVQLVMADVFSPKGEVIGQEVRKPRQGEPAFVQCRCQEKRSAPVAKDDRTSISTIEFLALAPVDVRVPKLLQAPQPGYRYAVPAYDVSRTILLRPPTAV